MSPRSRSTTGRTLATHSPRLWPTPPTFTEEEELALPTQFADAVALSTQIFTALAKNHDQFIKTETALRLKKRQ